MKKKLIIILSASLVIFISFALCALLAIQGERMNTEYQEDETKQSTTDRHIVVAEGYAVLLDKEIFDVDYCTVKSNPVRIVSKEKYWSENDQSPGYRQEFELTFIEKKLITNQITTLEYFREDSGEYLQYDLPKRGVELQVNGISQPGEQYEYAYYAGGGKTAKTYATCYDGFLCFGTTYCRVGNCDSYTNEALADFAEYIEIKTATPEQQETYRQLRDECE